MRCEFCDELDGGQSNAFTARYRHALASRVWLSSPSFVALPSLGQLAAGHTLIVPRRHVLSIGHLSADTDPELTLFKQRVADAIHRYGRAIWFEHGCVDELTNGGCGIYHAHLHAVPVTEEPEGVLAKLGEQFRSAKVSGWRDLSSRVVAGSPYLYYETSFGDRYVFEIPSPLPSQFMRQLISGNLGHHLWDWRAADFEPALVASVRDLQTAGA